MFRPRSLVLLALALTLVGCDTDDARVTLGPRDGRDLPPADTGRVQVGELAPDFSLESYRGDVVTLSDLRGRLDVVLVFYRGHW